MRILKDSMRIYCPVCGTRHEEVEMDLFVKGQSTRMSCKHCGHVFIAKVKAIFYRVIKD